MTVVGKILVCLNLVFSLVVGAFAVLSFSASSNHAAGFKELDSRYRVLGATADAYKAENDQLRAQARTFRDEIAKRGLKDADGKADAVDTKTLVDPVAVASRVLTVIDSRNKQIKALSEELKDTKKQFNDLKSTRNADRSVADNATETIARRDKEVKDMRLAMERLGDKNGELSRDLSNEKDRRVQAELEAGTLRETNKQLDKDYRDLMRTFQQARTNLVKGPPAPGGTGIGGSGMTGGTRRTDRGRDNPPLESVEGKVKKVDRDLLTISIGSDSGLTVGNTLQVFRLGTSPKYIGKIKLVSVEAKQAVGQVQGRPSTPIKVDDKVASSILGGY